MWKIYEHKGALKGSRSRGLMMKHCAVIGKATVHHASIFNTALFTK